MVTRRDFLKTSSLVSLGFLGLQKFSACSASGSKLAEGFGQLMRDPEKVLELPKGFSYKIISRAGEKMSDGFYVPTMHDGMAAFAGDDGKTILVRNHEVSSGKSGKHGPFGKNNELLKNLDSSLIYDNGAKELPCLGGTTTLVFDTKTQTLEKHFLSLTGTVRNCAGGPTPWGSWVSCEETVETKGAELAQDHGYNFEVPASSEIGLAKPVALKEMGRFNHEAIAVDPISGIVYETEDAGDGLIYRFIPNTPGVLADGGRLQALAVVDNPSLDTRNWFGQKILQGVSLPVYWIDLENVDSKKDDLRHRGYEHGAARFARGEGMWQGNDAIYFACTNGGRNLKGQIWKYIPSQFEAQPEEKNAPGKLELFIEPNDDALVDNADNLTVAPWGDLIICEDGSADQFLVGVTPAGKFYKLGHNVVSDSEFAGVTFSPDGSTLFVNIQEDGITLAITGSWPG